ncbi:PcfJ domain-containing protein [Bacillus licheniformis]|uniref:PcfJ domain-containing protein n=1 Tax=Bacillus licheniformis TaxID=1402 RepID=UPI0020C85CA5|nr:PcfJ domain-containing protein [Bacillus licheniformis]MCP8973198.1 PcfJ domain-containing protein [Bacillus licheniformis]
MEYKAQLSVQNGYRQDFDVYCTCGNHRKVRYTEHAGDCPECKTKYIKPVLLNSEGTATFQDNSYAVIYKDDQGFHIKRKEYQVNFNRQTKTIKATSKHTGELSFHLRDKEICITRDGKSIVANNANVNTFFKEIPKHFVLDVISTNRNRHLFDFCYETLGAMRHERSKMWGRGLQRLKDYPAVELFGLSQLSNKLLDLWASFKGVMQSKEVTAPHKMLGIPKVLMPYLARMHRYGKYEHKIVKELVNYFDGNSLKLILDILEEESDLNFLSRVGENLVELYRDYGYRNLRRTMLYVTREVKLEQGITSPTEALTYLRDFARMSKYMERSFDKYPKSLKKDHDIALLNYKANESEIKQKQMSSVIESDEYKSLELKSNDYSIIRPKSVADVIKEGDSLSHCVASYVDDIINRKCKIFFLRESKNLSDPLITIEVRGNIVRQVRGRFNRKPSSGESAFVRMWSNAKELKIQAYC